MIRRHRRRPSARRIDAGRISYVDDHGALASRHFINIASLGLSGATDRAVNADKRKGTISAKALFLWRTVVEFIRYRFQDVRITVDDGEPVEARMALVAVANGKFFGGGMMIAPDAELDDGLFDIVILRAAGKLGLILDLRLLYGGRHRDHPAITILRGTQSGGRTARRSAGQRRAGRHRRRVAGPHTGDVRDPAGRADAQVLKRALQDLNQRPAMQSPEGRTRP